MAPARLPAPSSPAGRSRRGRRPFVAAFGAAIVALVALVGVGACAGSRDVGFSPNDPVTPNDTGSPNVVAPPNVTGSRDVTTTPYVAPPSASEGDARAAPGTGSETEPDDDPWDETSDPPEQASAPDAVPPAQQPPDSSPDSPPPDSSPPDAAPRAPWIPPASAAPHAPDDPVASAVVTAGPGFRTPPVVTTGTVLPVAHFATAPYADVGPDGLAVSVVAADPSGVAAVEMSCDGGPWTALPTTVRRGLVRATATLRAGARTGNLTVYARVRARDGRERTIGPLALWGADGTADPPRLALPRGDISVAGLSALARPLATGGRRIVATAHPAGTRIVGAGVLELAALELVGCELEVGRGNGALLDFARGRTAALVLTRCRVSGTPASNAHLIRNGAADLYVYETTFERTRFGLPQYVRYAERIVVDGVREDSIKNPWCVVDVTIRNSGAGGGGAHPDFMQAQEFAAAKDIAENRLIARVRALGADANAGQGFFFKRITWSGAIVDCEIDNVHPTLNPKGVSCVLQAIQCEWRNVWIAHCSFTGRSILRDDTGFRASGVIIENTRFVRDGSGAAWNGGRPESRSPVGGLTYR